MSKDNTNEQVNDLDTFLKDTVTLTSEYSKNMIERIKTNLLNHNKFITIQIQTFNELKEKIQERQRSEEEVNEKREKSKKYELGLMKSIEGMDQEIEHTNIKNSELKLETERLRQEIALKKQNVELLKRMNNPSETVLDIEIENHKNYNEIYKNILAFRQKYGQYMKSLGLKFDYSDKTKLKLIFNNINRNNPNEEYWVEFSLLNDAFSIVNISHEIPGLSVFVDEANVTNNFSLLIQRVRRGFVNIANTNK